MLSIEQLEKVFKQKKQRIEKTISEKGIAKERLVAGFERTTFPEFKAWYEKSNYDQGCHYCQTQATKSEELYNKAIKGDAYNWTRGGKRGRRLEIDRKDPTKKYDDLENIVWCCYWCNNAKSNFFSEIEFGPIAKAIGEALKNM